MAPTTINPSAQPKAALIAMFMDHSRLVLDVPFRRIVNRSAWVDQHIASYESKVHNTSAVGTTITTVG